MNRRHFLTTAFAACASPAFSADHKERKTPFQISLAQWSNHRALQKGAISNLKWPAHANKTYGIEAVEYVNQFFKDKAKDLSYLSELRKRTEDLGMKNLLIMVDNEGHMGAASKSDRQKTIDNHKQWVDAAKKLGCHSIRVNSEGEGATDDEKAANCVKGLTALSLYARDQDLNVIVENHGGLSSNGAWMKKVLAEVGMPNCGSLPDFGNFWDYDRYQGLEELMPFAKGVSAKSHEFDADGNEVRTDFRRALKIVLKHNYSGWIGIEYEGDQFSEDEGILKTKALLETIRSELFS